MGIISYDKGEYNEALEYYNIAINIDPNVTLYLKNKGDAFAKLSKRDEAMECYQKAIEVDPYNADAYNCIGTLLHYKGQYETALEYYCVGDWNKSVLCGLLYK
ncbi:unnamed protein product [Blepharisma stoltei]|uniref:Tetratricopeptide repeat protein n=1 Tax=Blepharisma stoltei TaxID=1481888 RepID=A0AAU9IIV9_9CILI|nr:unnamed protein product [Blepharisma stoltei]